MALRAVHDEDVGVGGFDSHGFGVGVVFGVVPLAGALYAFESEDDGSVGYAVALHHFDVAAAREVFAAVLLSE